jgi:acetyl-CoA C-acetyltransferase
VNPREQVESFVCSSEDFLEGTSIFDEYVPDQLGAALRPVCTISADGLYSLITAYMQIRTGAFDVVAVEAHSKISDVVSPDSILELALDPVLLRALSPNPHFVAGLEMQRFLYSSSNTRQHCSLVAVKNRRNALLNSAAACGALITKEDIEFSEPFCSPLHRLDVSQAADGAAVVVIASAKKARKLTDRPVWISGVGWSTESSFESRNWDMAQYANAAGKMAFKMAGIKNPSRSFDFAEIDDTYSYKELQHAEALGLCPKAKSGRNLERGYYDRDGELPINPSGGSLGMGHTYEMSGLMRVAEAALQLRGEAGQHQVDSPRTAVAQCWRGIPTASGATVVLRGG